MARRQLIWLRTCSAGQEQMRTSRVIKVSGLPSCRNVPIGSQIRGDRFHRRDARQLKDQGSERSESDTCRRTDMSLHGSTHF